MTISITLKTFRRCHVYLDIGKYYRQENQRKVQPKVFEVVHFVYILIKTTQIIQI